MKPIDHLYQARDAIQKAIEELEVLSVTATRKSDHILVEWTGTVEDIQFSIDGGKTHSLRWMRENGYNPPPIEGNSYKLGKPDNIDKVWWIVAGTGEWNGEEFIFSESDVALVSSVDKTTPQRDILWGFWDGEKVPESVDYINVLKINIDQVQDVLDRGLKVIPFIGGFHYNQSEEDWRKRLRGKGSKLNDIDPDKIPFVILHDEPYPDKFTKEQLARLVDIAREEIGEHFLYTYSFTRTTIESTDPERTIPGNMDLVLVNFYPFYRDHIEWAPKIRTKEEFDAFFSKTLEKARKKSPAGAKFFFTAQGFESQGLSGQRDKWRVPPPESPQWLAEAMMREEDVLGATFFEYDGSGNNWTGTQEHQKLIDSIRGVFDLIE